MAIDKNGVTVTRAIRPKTDDELAAQRAAELEEFLPSPIARIVADLDNRLRAIEGKGPRSADEFRDAAVASRA